MLCPFLPVCKANLPLVPQRASVDSQEIITVYPAHEVVGPASWYGRCPGSFCLVSAEGTLTRAADAMLREARGRFSRLSVLRMQAETHAADIIAEVLSEPEPTVTRPQPPAPEDYFPGRPADAPEPGPNDPPDLPVPTTVQGSSLTGRSPVDNGRENLLALIDGAMHAFGQTQDKLSAATNALDGVDAVLDLAEADVGLAVHLAHAAVGTGDAAPEAATNMVTTALAGRFTIDDDGNGVRGAIALARSRVALAYASMQAATEHARAYRATI